MGFFSKVFSKIFDDILGFDPKKPPPLPPLPPPPTEKITGTPSAEQQLRQRKRVSGRRKTIIAGELSPTRVGKVNLLGR